MLETEIYTMSYTLQKTQIQVRKSTVTLFWILFAIHCAPLTLFLTGEHLLAPYRLDYSHFQIVNQLNLSLTSKFCFGSILAIGGSFFRIRPSICLKYNETPKKSSSSSSNIYFKVSTYCTLDIIGMVCSTFFLTSSLLPFTPACPNLIVTSLKSDKKE